MTRVQLKNRLRLFVLLGFSTLLIVSFQNCQGIDAETIQSSLEAPGGGIAGGEPLPNDPTPEPDPIPDPVDPVEPTACEIGNVTPKWVESRVENGNGAGEIVFESDIDEDTGSLQLSKVIAKADAGKKGINPNNSNEVNDPTKGEQDSLRNLNCTVSKIGEASGNLDANCNFAGDGVNVSISNANNNECVSGKFRLRITTQDSCGATTPNLDFVINSANVCFDQVARTETAANVISAQGDNFGTSIKKVNDLVVVSAPNASKKNALGGTFYVYKINSSTKKLGLIKIIEPSDSRNDKYVDFAFKDGYLVVGSSTIGKVKVYKQNGNDFQYVRSHSFTYSNLYNFGKSIGILDGAVVVGSPGENSVYLYSLSNGNQLSKLTKVENLFGEKLESFSWNSNSFLLLSSTDAGKGIVYTYSLNGNQLKEESRYVGKESCFGQHMKADSNYVFIGSSCSSIARVWESDEFLNSAQKTVLLEKTVRTSADNGSIGTSFAYHQNIMMFGAPSSNSGSGWIMLSKLGDNDFHRKIMKTKKAVLHSKQEFGSSMVSHNGILYVGAPNFSSSTELLKGRIIYVDLNN